MSYRTTKTTLAFVALLGLSATVSAETWITTSSTLIGSNSVDPLDFDGSDGTRVTIDGFRVQFKNGGGSAYDSPYATAWGSGVGVRRDGNDRHTIGNNASNYNWTDGILLDFGTSLVSISGITLASDKGWGDGSSDRDFELWAYTGGGAGDLPTASYSLWAGNDWTKVADVNGLQDTASGTDYDTYATASATNSSRWIVLAANNDSNKDAYKFKGFTASKGPCIPGTPGCGGGTTEVPVPGTLALLGLAALLGRRRLFSS